MNKDPSIDPESIYTGRFAPSPTGPLHFGSLVAAMASYLDAKSHQGQWLLRIEDLDPPREVEGAADSIIHNLARFGFEWDGQIVYQSQRQALYTEAIDELLEQKLAYACNCSRKSLAQQLTNNNAQIRYPGNCRYRKLPIVEGNAVRALVENQRIHFTDRLHGNMSENLHTQVGDFVIKRKDGYFAYQLAVVIDDAEQKITHVVRGDDLLDSTPRQIHLHKLLSLHIPQYAHTPLVFDKAGNKFSKSSNHGQLLQANLESLIEAWHFLRQEHTKKTEFDTITDFWKWATANWDMKKLVNKDGD